MDSEKNFPSFEFEKLLSIEDNNRWQVLCGDESHWRLGIYSPEFSKISQIDKLEHHDCPELFMLIEGEMSLLIYNKESQTKETLILEKNKPVMVSSWHNGFCPNGPFTGKALVIERDKFDTEYLNWPLNED